MSDDERQRAVFMEDQDADRRQPPEPEAPPPQTPGEGQGPGYSDLPPGEEAGEAGKETRGN